MCREPRHDEDRETVLFNLNNSGLHKTKFIAIEDIIVSDEGLFDQEGDKINFLYRLYPLEYLLMIKILPEMKLAFLFCTILLMVK
ncbi:hypothetical protein [Peribacillus frigoritolerans]|uniref:hypothetical protein n=1 Tax=Peribacillus frigoritolerans TaxID=450367 RepID=UPI003D2B7735